MAYEFSLERAEPGLEESRSVLLVGTFAARLLFGLSPVAQDAAIAVLTYLVGIPFLLFFDVLLPARWHRLMLALTGISAAFALFAIFTEAIRRAELLESAAGTPEDVTLVVLAVGAVGSAASSL